MAHTAKKAPKFAVIVKGKLAFVGDTSADLPKLRALAVKHGGVVFGEPGCPEIAVNPPWRKSLPGSPLLDYEAPVQAPVEVDDSMPARIARVAQSAVSGTDSWGDLTAILTEHMRNYLKTVSLDDIQQELPVPFGQHGPAFAAWYSWHGSLEAELKPYWRNAEFDGYKASQWAYNGKSIFMELAKKWATAQSSKPKEREKDRRLVSQRFPDYTAKVAKVRELKRAWNEVDRGIKKTHAFNMMGGLARIGSYAETDYKRAVDDVLQMERSALGGRTLTTRYNFIHNPPDEISDNPPNRLPTPPAEFRNWRVLAFDPQGRDGANGARTGIYTIKAPNGREGRLVSHDGAWRFVEQLDMFAGHHGAVREELTLRPQESRGWQSSAAKPKPPQQFDLFGNPPKTITLYRAADDDYLPDGASFARSKEDAEAYLDNGNFGGSTLYSAEVKPKNVLDLYDLSSSKALQTLCNAVGVEHPGAIGAEEFAPMIAGRIRAAGFDWVRVRDSFPEDCETWQFYGGDEPELVEVVLGNPRARYVNPQQQGFDWGEWTQPLDVLPMFAPLAPSALPVLVQPVEVPEEAPVEVAAVRVAPELEPVYVSEPASEPTVSAPPARAGKRPRAAAPDTAHNAAKLRAAAERIAERATEKLNADRQENTYRRQRIADGQREDARADLGKAQTMQRLADAIEAGQAPLLAGVNSAAEVETLAGELKSANWKQPRSKTEKDRYGSPDLDIISAATLDFVEFDGYSDIPEGQWGDMRRAEQRRLAALGITDTPSLKAALAEFLPCYTGKIAIDAKQTMRSREQKIAMAGYAGYFPTPPAVIAEMLTTADIGPGDRVLEPSAGCGHIAVAAREAGAVVDVCEQVPAMRELLKDKGFNVIGDDALEIEGQWPKILMNPPFEGGQDALQVRHAYENNLAPGGVLVAITSEGPFFRSFAKDKAFVQFVEDVGESQRLPAGSFMSSDRQTGVATRIVTLRKPTASLVALLAGEPTQTEWRYGLRRAPGFGTSPPGWRDFKKDNDHFFVGTVAYDRKLPESECRKWELREITTPERVADRIYREVLPGFSDAIIQMMARLPAERQAQYVYGKIDESCHNVIEWAPQMQVAEVLVQRLLGQVQSNPRPVRVDAQRSLTLSDGDRSLDNLPLTFLRQAFADRVVDGRLPFISGTLDFTGLPVSDNQRQPPAPRPVVAAPAVLPPVVAAAAQRPPRKPRQPRPVAALTVEAVEALGCPPCPPDRRCPEVTPCPEQRECPPEVDCPACAECAPCPTAPEPIIEVRYIDAPCPPCPVVGTDGVPTLPYAAEGPPLIIGHNAAGEPIGMAAVANGEPIEYVWRIMDIGDVITSHDPWTTERNAAYPQEIQPRDRSRASYRDQITKIAQRLDPHLLMWNASVSDGAPVVGPDGVVESGNGRTMALARVFRSDPDRAAEYWRVMAEWAAVLGVATPDSAPNPMLVRVRQSDVDRAEFARRANVAGQQVMAIAEQAMADAEALTPAMLVKLAPESDIASGENGGFVGAFIANVAGQQAVGQMQDEHSRLSRSGENRIMFALFGYAYGDQSKRLISELAEFRDTESKQALNGMLIGAPAVARLQAFIELGEFGQEFDPAPSLVEMFNFIAACQKARVTVAQRLNQQVLEGIGDRSPELQAWLAAMFATDRASQKRLALTIEAFCTMAENYKKSTQGMFDAGPSAIDLIQEATAKVVFGSSDPVAHAKKFMRTLPAAVWRHAPQIWQVEAEAPEKPAKPKKAKPGEVEAPPAQFIPPDPVDNQQGMFTNPHRVIRGRAVQYRRR